jgi:structure-specific endonuclease subunit SLX1
MNADLPCDTACVYILRHSTRPQAGYVGATLNLTRRLRQHNGELVGGARRTTRARCNGAWSLLVSVHGLQTYRNALRFEWALKRECRALHARTGPKRIEALQALMQRSHWTRASPPAGHFHLEVVYH